MRNVFAFAGVLFILGTSSSYAAERVIIESEPVVEKKVYVRQEPVVVEERVEVVHPHHYHHDEVIEIK